MLHSDAKYKAGSVYSFRTVLDLFMKSSGGRTVEIVLPSILYTRYSFRTDKGSQWIVIKHDGEYLWWSWGTHWRLLMLFLFLSFAEQIGQEILSNLHTDREKIQRSRDRVSVFMHKLKHVLWLYVTALPRYWPGLGLFVIYIKHKALQIAHYLRRRECSQWWTGGWVMPSSLSHCALT